MISATIYSIPHGEEHTGIGDGEPPSPGGGSRKKSGLIVARAHDILHDFLGGRVGGAFIGHLTPPVQHAHAAGMPTSLVRGAGSDLRTLTFDHVIEAAQAGDPLAADTLREASRALGLVNAINLIDPEAVIIGHKLNTAGELALDPIRQVISQQAIPQAAARLNILASQIPEPVGVTGAACHALSSLLRDSHYLLHGMILNA